MPVRPRPQQSQGASLPEDDSHSDQPHHEGAGTNMIRLRHLNGVLVPRLDHIAAREHAAALLKKAGFKMHQVAQNSTSVYYYHLARAPFLLRVADHPSKGSPMGLGQTVARLTISPKDKYLTETHIGNLVANAIGRYFLTDPKPSEYDGPNMERNN